MRYSSNQGFKFLRSVLVPVVGRNDGAYIRNWSPPILPGHRIGVVVWAKIRSLSLGVPLGTVPLTNLLPAIVGLQIHQRLDYSVRNGQGLGALACVILLLSLEANGLPLSSTPQSTSEASVLGECSQPALLGEYDELAEQNYNRGQNFLSAGDEIQAEKEFRAAVAKRPKRDKYIRSLARFQIDRGRHDEAIGVIAEYVKQCGVTALGYELEAELLFQQKLYDPALEAVLGSLKLYNPSPRMHQLLGLIYVVKGQATAAALELRKAVELDPNHAQTRYFLGRVLYSSGAYAEARDQFLACLKLQPGYRKAFENLGLCYEALEDYAKATQAYLDAIALEEKQVGPKHAEPYAFYGAMLARSSESEKALAVLREGVALSPKSFVANYHLGKLLLNLGRNEEAEKFLLAAADLAPKFSRTYYLLGSLRQKQNRRPEAERYFKMFKEFDQVAENRVFPLTDR